MGEGDACVCDMYVLVCYIRAGDVCTRVRSVCRATDDKCQSKRTKEDSREKTVLKHLWWVPLGTQDI